MESPDATDATNITDAAPAWVCPCCGKSSCDGYCTVGSWDFSDCRGG